MPARVFLVRLNYSQVALGSLFFAIGLLAALLSVCGTKSEGEMPERARPPSLAPNRLAALPEILKRLGAADSTVRQDACHDLQKFGLRGVDPLIQMFHDHDPEVRTAATSALLVIETQRPGPEVVTPHILSKVAPVLRARAPHARMEAAEFLGKHGSDAAVYQGDLLRALQDPHPGVRVVAAWACVKVGNRTDQVWDVLVSGLKESLVVFYALDGMLQLFHPFPDDRTVEEKGRQRRQLEPLIPELTRLTNHPKAIVRGMLASLLGDYNPADERSLRTLTSLLADRDMGVRYAAVVSLSEVGAAPLPRRFFEVSREGLRSTAWSTRLRMCRALGAIHNLPPDVITELVNALNDSSDDVCFEIACLLSRHKHEPAQATENVLLRSLAVFLKDRYRSQCVEAIEALTRLGHNTQEVRRALQQCLTDEEENIRAAAQRGLASFEAKPRDK